MLRLASAANWPFRHSDCLVLGAGRAVQQKALEGIEAQRLVAPKGRVK